MDLVRRLLPVVAWLAGLVVVLAGLTAAGAGSLAAPPLGDPGAWGDWAADRTAPEAAMAVFRLVALALTWYLLVVTVLAIVLRAGRAGRLVTAADVVTLPFVRGLVQAGLGVGLAGAALAAVGAADGPARGAPTAADAALVAQVGTGGDAVMQQLPAEGEVPVMQRVAEPASVEPARTWTVAPGDHLWSIAERVLADGWGRAPTDAEVVPYWEQVIEANRAGLADPGNPDLLFPGQTIVLPEYGPAP